MVKTFTESTDIVENILIEASRYCKNYKKTLYHYTNAEGLKGIISKGEIWGTHYKFTNDPSELYYSYKLIIQILEKHFDKEKNPRAKELLENYLEFQKKIIDVIDIYGSYNIFVASFSEKKDLLSQWRGYGDNGYGYSIGIDLYKTGRKKVGLPTFQPLKSKKIHLIRLIYDEKIQKIILDDYIEQLKNFYIKNEDININVNSGLIGAIYIMVFPLIACLLKSPHFKEEKEWRLIYPLNDEEFKINYRVKNKVVVPYIKMNITKDSYNYIPFNDILFGPKLDEIKAKMGLKMLLNDCGYKDSYCPDLYKSSIPFA